MNAQASPHRDGVITTRMRRGTIACPVCNHDAGIRTSEQETKLVKNLWCFCLNVTCGHTFKMQLSFVYTISPSSIEVPGLSLPQAPPHFVRHIYPAGPPAGHAPDPNQLDLFDDPDEEPEPERTDAAAWPGADHRKA